jgi:1,4-dihydroxy-2-naphthoyl-CoA hydrolase
MEKQDLVDRLKDMRAPWDDLTRLVIESASAERVTGSLEIDPAVHMQPFGLVHGGVWASIAETLASLGAALGAMEQAKTSAGMENHTSFLRSVTTAQRVTAVAEPIHQGRTTAAWEVRISDAQGRLVARSYVRLAIIEPR